jgi:aminoglycoside phosphotransferase
MDFIKHAQMLLKKHVKEDRLVKELRHNHVSIITDDNKKPYIIKYVDQLSLSTLKFEKRMSEFLAAKLNLPIPKFIEIDTYQTCAYMFREIIAGEPLSKIIEENAQIQSLIYDSGQKLALIHHLELEHKGFINEKFEVEEANIFSQEEYETIINIFIKHHTFNNDELYYLKKIPIETLFSIKPYVLCHADYHPNHIIVKNFQNCFNY